MTPPRPGNHPDRSGVHGVTMRRIVICSGVLGGGTALVFALAAATATLFPHGTVVPTNQFGWGGGMWMEERVRMAPIGIPELQADEMVVDGVFVDPKVDVQVVP